MTIGRDKLGGGPPARLPDFEIIRDPLWDNIRLDRPALLTLDTPTVQRLRYMRQVGHAFLVYPGATHTRFEHALGAYHLTRRASGARGAGECGRCPTRIASQSAWPRSCTTSALPLPPRAGGSRLSLPRELGIAS